MSGWLMIRLRAAIAAAATLTGKRFGLLVASSLVATSAIVAAAATNQPEASPLRLDPRPQPRRRPHPGRGGPARPAEPEPEPEEEAGRESVAHESTPAPEPNLRPDAGTGTDLRPGRNRARNRAGTGARRRSPAEEEPAPPPPKPEAGRIKHVFLISLVSSGYEAAFGTTAPTMPYLSGTLRPKGLLLTNYSVLSEAMTPNGIATISGQPPNKATEDGVPDFTAFPSTSKTSKAGVVSGEGCVYPVETQTLADQLEVGQFTWKGYIEGMEEPDHRRTRKLRLPGAEEEETSNPAATRRGSTRSPTSTRCSTSATAREATCRSPN